MPTLTTEDVELFEKINRNTDYKLRAVARQLKLVSSGLDQYSIQTQGDLKAGRIKVGEVYIPITTAANMLFVDHFPMSYVDNIVSIMGSYIQTRPVLSKWLVTRSFLETIYDRAKVSTCDFSEIASNQVPKVKRYRMLTVLDFKLCTATYIDNDYWYNEYISMRNYALQQEDTKSSDIVLFPESKTDVKVDATKRDRLRLFSDLSSVFRLEKPVEYKQVYDTTSRLIHGNPLQMLVSEKLTGQWRERFLLHSLFLRSCIDLFKVIEAFVHLPESSQTRNKTMRHNLELFYENELKPGWRHASEKELGN